MSDWDMERYRERERYWRGEARKAQPGRECDACNALADGYAKLVKVLEQEVSSRITLPPLNRPVGAEAQQKSE